MSTQYLISCSCFQMKNFKSLVKKNFEKSKVTNETIQIMRDFVIGCMRLNPQDRPDIDEVLQHRLFGGPDLFLTKANDVWTRKGEF